MRRQIDLCRKKPYRCGASLCSPWLSFELESLNTGSHLTSAPPLKTHSASGRWYENSR